MTGSIKNVLFLCTHNSARSVMAEALLNRHGAGKFKAFSAGSQPSGRINPSVKSLLDRLGFDTSEFRSKDWSEFAKPGAPVMDIVVTVCDQAAGETCPIWPGRPMTAHWGFPDPSSFEGTEAEKAEFTAQVYAMIERRIRIFASLPITTLSDPEIKRRIDEMGQEAAPA